MAKLRPSKDNMLTNALYRKGDLVECIDSNLLSEDATKFIKARKFHPIRHVYSALTEPILILEPIEGVEYPMLGGKPYPFMSDRFRKIENGQLHI